MTPATMTTPATPDATPDFGDLVPLRSIAERFNVTYETARTWTDKPGGLECWRAGGRLYTTERAVSAFLQAGRKAPTAS